MRSMGPRPWKPKVELEGALDRGQLDAAKILALEAAEDRGGPIDLATALRFLPIVAEQRPSEFDAWACKWFCRWLAEKRASIEQAAEVAASLADLPAEPAAQETLARFC
jgi:hypothetical protein